MIHSRQQQQRVKAAALTWLKLQEYLVVFLRHAGHDHVREVVALVQLRPEARRTVQRSRLIDDEIEMCRGDAHHTHLGQPRQRPNHI